MNRVDQRTRPGLHVPKPPRTYSGTGIHPGQPAVPKPEPEDTSAVHKIAYYAGLGWLFLMFGTIPELLSYLLHVNTYLLYVFAPPALIGVLLTGAVPRTMKGRAAWFWVFFLGYMVVT